MLPKIFQFGKSKADNWKPGSFSGGVNSRTAGAYDVLKAPKHYSKPEYVAGGAPDRKNPDLGYGAGGTGQSASWTDTNSGYDLTH
jgi:hypothetical protein